MRSGCPPQYAVPAISAKQMLAMHAVATTSACASIRATAESRARSKLFDKRLKNVPIYPREAFDSRCGNNESRTDRQMFPRLLPPR